MSWDKQIEIVKKVKVEVDNPLFFQRVYSQLSKERRLAKAKDGDNLRRLCSEDYQEISRQIDRSKIQESCAVRNVLRTRRLANLLINDKGELNSSFIPKVIKYLKENLYFLGPDRQYDAKRQEQILNVLLLLQSNKELVRLLKRISKPFSHKYAEQMIRETLQLSTQTVVSDAHARRAVLAAWMCTLRQSVGSCFATAPAIIIHDEQPEKFLQDINDLLSTGRLKRTFGGIEYSVPLSASWGIGDLKKLFFLQREINLSAAEIWQSPSLIQALEVVQLIDRGIAQKEKGNQVKQLIETLLHSWEGSQLSVLLSIEEILKRLLMRHFGITAQDLEDYDNRSKGMLHSNLIVQISKTSLGSGGKGGACASYYQQIELAKNTFKAFADNALLKAWEFTIASFSESKANFARWNLYSSLGLGPEEQGGIGGCIYEIIKRSLELCNQKVQEFQLEYEQMYSQVKFLENRMRQASTEREQQWLKIEYQTKSNEFYLFQELRDKTHEKAKRFANLFNVLIELYDSKFPEYFQEVYDADMHDVQMGPYDDSPAGFRLLFKHGRSDTAQWSRIKNANEFIEALSTFFMMTENEISADDRLVGMEEEISRIVTAVVIHIKTPEFIETAFYRMAIAHRMPIIKNPLENLDKVEKKPWAYTSGGTMGTLISCYYKRDQKPTEVSRYVESEIELAVFLIDTLKQMPYQMTKEYIDNPQKSLLIHSPTHAFLLKPGKHSFKESWQSEVFTYTWVRDRLVKPMQNFVEEIILDEEMISCLILKIKDLVHPNYQHHFQKVFSRHYQKISPKDFRDFILQTIAFDPGFRFADGAVMIGDEIDALLFSHLPLFPNIQLRGRLEKIFHQLAGIIPPQIDQLMSLFDETFSSTNFPQIISAKELKEIGMTLLSLVNLETANSIDFHYQMSLTMQKLGFGMPVSLIFADTNWAKDEFGFVINPGTEKFELWRIDYIGSTGMPMSGWKKWVDGSHHQPTWGVYTRPYEYR